MTEEFILSEIENSIKTDCVGMIWLSIVLLIIGIWLFSCFKEIIKKYMSVNEENGKRNKINIFEIFATLFITFCFGAFIYISVESIDDLLIKKYAVENCTYELNEYNVVNKYFERKSDHENGYTYSFSLELENYGEKYVSEEEYDKISIGDSVYLLLVNKNEKRCEIGVYLVGEYFYQD